MSFTQISWLFKIALYFPGILFISQCNTGKKEALLKVAKAESIAYERQMPLTASRELQPLVNKNNADKMLVLLEAGTLLQMAGRYEDSAKVFSMASKMQDAMFTSVTAETGAFFSNETGKDYFAEDYESVNLSLLQGMNFLMLGNYESARVEFRKVNEKLELIKNKTGRAWKINLMAKYMAYIAFTMEPSAEQSDLEYGYIELKQIETLQPGIPEVIRGLYKTAHRMGDEEEKAYWRKKYPSVTKLAGGSQDKSELLIVYASGKSPQKESRGKLMSDMSAALLIRASVDSAILIRGGEAISPAIALQSFHLAEHPIPKYSRREYRAHAMQLTLKNKKYGKNIFTGKSALLNNNVEIILRNFEENYEKMKSDLFKRMAVKVVTTLIAAKGAEKIAENAGVKNSALQKLIGSAVGFGVGAATIGSERADLRSWRSLPANFQIISAEVPEGEYSVNVRFLDSGGSVLWERNAGSLTLKPGQRKVQYVRTTY